jgi:hypothetical protein
MMIWSRKSVKTDVSYPVKFIGVKNSLQDCLRPKCLAGNTTIQPRLLPRASSRPASHE